MKAMARQVTCIAALLALAAVTPAGATDVALTGLYGGKALVVIDGGPPRSIPMGVLTPEGVKLISVDGTTAVFEIDGRRQRLTVGDQAVVAERDQNPGKTITLKADPRGHFYTVGTINGAQVRFKVDTGATKVSIGKSDAARANINYREGRPGTSKTAKGPSKVWRVTFDSVRVGDVVLNQVEGLVHEEYDLPVALLGMSFLSQMEMKMEMKHEGLTMTLKKRY
jgi:aspartyl protease family protein